MKNPIGRSLRRLVEASHREASDSDQDGPAQLGDSAALQLPVLGTFWRVPERFWEPSRRFLNRVFTGFFCLLFLCCFFCFFCFFLFLSSFFCFFISSFNSFFFSFYFLFVHVSNYVWELPKIFPFQNLFT